MIYDVGKYFTRFTVAGKPSFVLSSSRLFERRAFNGIIFASTSEGSYIFDVISWMIVGTLITAKKIDVLHPFRY